MSRANVGARFSASLSAAGTEHSASAFDTQPTPESQSTSPVQSQKQKLSNPLNDLLDEAQRDIDKNDFEAAITPLQKFLAEKPDVAYGPLPARLRLHRPQTRPRSPRRIRTRHRPRSENVRSLSQSGHSADGTRIPPPPSHHCAKPSSCFPRKAAHAFFSASRRNALAISLAPPTPSKAPCVSILATLKLLSTSRSSIYNLKRPADAEAKFRSVLEVQPTSAAAALGLAQTLDAQNKPEAADAYRKYLALQPADSAARARLVAFSRRAERQRRSSRRTRSRRRRKASHLGLSPPSRRHSDRPEKI